MIGFYTQAQAEEAIKARVDGEWDNKQLMRLGPLTIHTEEDIERIKMATKK